MNAKKMMLDRLSALKWLLPMALLASGCYQAQGPKGLSYANPDAVYMKDGKISDNIPSIKGSVTRWEVEPMLPVGIVMDPGTGIISGTPVALQERRTYTVTASGSQGHTSAEIAITVNLAPPGPLTYRYPDAVYNEGGLIINNVPVVSGSGITFTVTPTLPTGLFLDPATGIIWGTPAGSSPKTGYTVTAANSSGSSMTVISITVNLSAPPSGLSYSSPVSTYIAGHAIADNVPTVSGSGITFTVAPALPSGLSLDPASGIISGTPATKQALTDYTVTATNGKGSVTSVVGIKIDADALLSGLSLSAGTLYPDFNPSTGSYTVRLPLGAASITVTPTASDSAAAITVNGTLVLSGQASVTTNPGATTVTVVVTAVDAVTTMTYTLRAVRGYLPESFIKGANTGVLDHFGQSVALSGDTLVVGSPYESSGGRSIVNGATAPVDRLAPSSGAVYVFRRTGGAWVQEAFIKASNADSYDEFGRSVAIDGDVIAVGAPLEDSSQQGVTNGTGASADNSSNASGAVYVFRRTGSTWVQEAYLKAPNADANDEFGRSISVSGDTVVVGCPYEYSNETAVYNGTGPSPLDNDNAKYAGAVYVFRRTGGVWDQEAYLKAPNSQSFDYFGVSVSISGDTIAVGAYQEDSNQTTITNGTTASADNSSVNSGAVYVFRRSGTAWAQEAYIKASNSTSYTYFGNNVSIDGDTIAVGAYYRSSQAGAAYVYKRSVTSWAEEAFLTAPNAESGDYFGYRVAVYADTLAVSAYSESANDNICFYGSSASTDNTAPKAGAVYVFKRSGSAWSNNAYLKAPNSDADDNFGTSIAVWGNLVVTGAPYESSSRQGPLNGITAPSDNDTSESGAAYVFAE